MMTTILISIFITFMLVLTWVGLRMGAESDLLLAGRKTRTLPLMLTFLATQLGGGTIVGAMEAAAQGGWNALFYALGTVLGFILLASGFGPWLRRQEVSTVAEIFETIYKAPTLRKIAAVLSVVSLFLILVAQATAMRKMMGAFGVSSDLLLLAIWGLVTLYTSFGGFKAVVVTDVIQVTVIIGALAIVAIEVLFSTGIPTPAASSSEIPWMQWLAMPALYMFVEQDMGQRCCAAENPRTVRRSAAGAGLLLACVAVIPVMLGILGAPSGLDPLGAVATVCSPAATVIFYAAVLLAILSTADSLLSSITSNIVQDLGGQQWSRSKTIAVTVFVGVGSATAALFADSVISILLISYELLVCVLSVPVLGAALAPRASNYAATTAMVVGGSVFALASLMGLGLPAAVIALPLATLGYIVGFIWEAPMEVDA